MALATNLSVQPTVSRWVIERKSLFFAAGDTDLRDNSLDEGELHEEI